MIVAATLIHRTRNDRPDRLRQRRGVHLDGMAVDHPRSVHGGGRQLGSGRVDDDRLDATGANVDADQNLAHVAALLDGFKRAGAGGWATTAVTPLLNVSGPAAWGTTRASPRVIVELSPSQPSVPAPR